MHATKVLPLFAELRRNARESSLITGTTQFASLVATAQSILERVGDLLALDVWERLTFDPEFPWPGIHKRRHSIRTRRAMFQIHQKRLRRESATLDDVLVALDFARKQVLVMFNEVHIGLLRGDVSIPADLPRRSALTLLRLTTGFRRRWRALRLDLVSLRHRTENSV